MAKTVNNHKLKSTQNGSTDERPIMVSVQDVSMVFNMASEQLNSLKEYMIALARKELRFKEFRALNHISLEIKKGDVFGILGTNGSGKSTLLKIIAGVLEPSEGSIKINGNIAPLIELGAGFDMDLTARENIYLNGALLGYSKDLIDDKFDEIIEFAEIESFLDIPIKNYSSGMMARIAFSIATVVVPDILVVDEVLSVGDFMFQRKCENKIRQLIDEHGVTVLIVSHSNEQIERLCNQAIWIEKGNCRIMGSAEEVCRVYTGLGGRTGSEESERNVFDHLDSIDSDERPDLVFEGNPYAISVALAEKGSTDTHRPSTIILASCATHINSIYANTLSRHFKAPVLPVTTTDIPSEVIQYLYDAQPERIIYIDCGEAGRDVIPKIEKLPFLQELIDLSGTGDVGQYSNVIFSFGLSHDIWTEDSAFLLDFEASVEGLSSTPLLYEKACPVIITRSSANEGDIADLIDLAKQNGIRRIIAIGSIAGDEAVMEQCNDLEVIKIAQSTSLEERCGELARLYDKVVGEGRLRGICISSLSESQWIACMGLGRYATHTSSHFFPIDVASLDSVSSCIDFLERHRHTIKDVSIVGSEGEIPLLYQLMFNSIISSDSGRS